MSHLSSPSSSLGRASGRIRGGNDDPESEFRRDGLRPPYSPSAPAPNANLDSDAVADTTSRLGLPHSQSSRSIPPLDSPGAVSISPYSSLQYAPRQKSSNQAFRASQQLFQSHGSLWNQQQSQNNAAAAASEPPSPSLLTSYPTSTAPASSPVLSTMAINGVPPSVENTSSDTNVSAAAKLAKQQLRADAEELGLRVGSVGWAVLDRLQSAAEGEWRELGEMLSRGEGTLLLPTTPLKSSEVSLSHAYNHTIFATGLISSASLFDTPTKGKEREHIGLVTFKGLRADMTDVFSESVLRFKSFIPRDDMGFVSQMKITEKRADLFSTLAPLPVSNERLAAWPSFKVLSHTSNLLLPPILSRRESNASRASRSRSGSAGPFLSPDQQVGIRTSASFATLFGGRREKRLSAIGVGEEGKELKSFGEAEGPVTGDSATTTFHVAQPTRRISIAIIDGEIRRGPVLADIVKSMKARIRLTLSQDDEKRSLPDDLIDVVCSFAAILVPPSTLAATISAPSTDSRSGSTDTEMMKSPTNAVLHSPFSYTADQLADSFQDFFNSIKSQLEVIKEEVKVEEELDRIEAVVCSEVYDRIFCPYMSLDVFHDEALALRIAALNEMNISLRHLGLLVPEQGDTKEQLVRAGIDDIIARCGMHLQSLGDKSCTSPGSKLSALVTAHKVIVESLGKLPKIELMEEAEAAAVVKEREKNSNEMEEGSKSASSSTSSADVILPILIYCVIKSNPPKLASNLLYIQRFRAEALIQGEASYCLVNVQAAVAFLENVEPESLGLVGNVQMVTATDLEQRSHKGNIDGLSSTVEGNNSVSMPMRMRHRVAHDVGELAGISNRVITGVLGSSLGAFGRMMGAGTNLAMGFDATGGSSKAAGETQSRKKSVEDIRGVLSGGAAAKLGSVLNKVVAMENEGRGPRETKDPSRPRPAYRTTNSGGRAATDYGREMDDGRGESNYSIPPSTKASISDRLASIPILSRASTSTSTTSSPPKSQLSLQQNAQSTDRAASTSPAQIFKNLPGLPLALSKGNEGQQLQLHNPSDMLLHPEELADGLRSPISPTSYLDPHLLRSPSHSISSQNTQQATFTHIPASLQSPYPPLSHPPSKERPLHVVLASTGSVASVKIPLIVDALLKHNNVRIQIISTRESSRFYDRQKMLEEIKEDNLSHVNQPYTVESLATENREADLVSEADRSGAAIPRLHFWKDEDDAEQWSQIGDPILHIELRRWADIVLIAPCSANTLAKINAGICDNLLTNFLRALSPSTPTYLFPAMNTLMYLHPLTARHLEFVRDVLGYHVIGPIAKRLACGDLGQGAMQEWSEIVDLVVQRYSLVKLPVNLE